MSEEALSKLIYLCSLGCEKTWKKYVKTKDQTYHTKWVMWNTFADLLSYAQADNFDMLQVYMDLLRRYNDADL